MKLPESSSEFVGVSSSSTLTAKWDEDNKVWKVQSVIDQSRTKDGVDWETKEVETSSVNSDINKALKDVFLTIEYYFQKINGDLFSAEDINDGELLQ